MVGRDDVTNFAEAVADKIEWYEDEIKRMREVIAEQDRRAKTTTVRGEIRMGKDGPVFIVTAADPAKEEHLMRAVFSGFVMLQWTGLAMAFEAMWPDKNVKDLATVMFDRDE